MPIESIKDVGNLLSPVWDKLAGELGGQEVTLGEIELKILRPMGIHEFILRLSVPL